MLTDDFNALLELDIEHHPQYPTDVRERLKVLTEPINNILNKSRSDLDALCWSTQREDITELITQALRFLDALDRDEEFFGQGIQGKEETQLIDY